MVRRQAEGEDAMLVDRNEASGAAENSIARRAANARSRTKALARRLRRSGRMAALTADISEGIERIAGLSDRIIGAFEQARGRTDTIAAESREGARLLEGLAAASGETRERSAGNAVALEELLSDFHLHAGAVRRLITTIQTAAEHHSGLLKTAQELSRSGGELDSLSERLGRLLERADVAGLNAALEAGKAGTAGAGFNMAASMAQKRFASFDRKTGEFLALLGRVREAHAGLAGRAGEAADRIRAIVVMTKGVRNALDDAVATIEDLRDISQNTAARIQSVFEGLETAAPALDTVPGSVDRALGVIDLTASRIEEQEQAFAGAADHAERLLSSTGQLAATDDLAGVLDDIYADADSFIRALETTAERVERTLESIHDALHGMDLLRQGTDGHREVLEGLIRTADGALSDMDGFRQRIAGLRVNLESALGVFRDVSRELGVLREDEDALAAGLDSLRPLYAGVSRFSGRLGAYAGAMTALAVSGGMEALRSGDAGAGFTAPAGEFEVVAAEADGLEDVVGDLGEHLGERLFAMGRTQSLVDWRGLADAFEEVTAGVQTMTESRLDGAVRHGEALAALLAGHSRNIAGVMARTDAVVTAAEEAVRSITEAVGLGEGQKEAFRQTLSLAEKVTTLADELYPEEEE